MNQTTVKRVAVVQGAPSAAIQELFSQLADHWRPRLRITGVVAEAHGLLERKCSAGYLRNIVNGERFPIFQDLGPGAQACQLEAGGGAKASAAVENDIAAGCDLVILSKFGKMEAMRQGLADAFHTAIAAEIPVLTSVSPAFEAAWREFASPLFVILPADHEQIEMWKQSVCTGSRPRNHHYPT